ncbi:MAG: hypothetical protein PHI99_02415 [Syntrophales bacterium]|nr:hypothetical protein [Syntrophales bacterium]
MNHDEWIKIHSSLDTAFENNSVTNATDDELQSWLQNLSTGNTVNETIRYREIIRGITINSLITKRHIDRLNTRSEFIQWLVIIFAFFSLIASAINIFISLQTKPPIVIQQPVQIAEAAKKTVPHQKPDAVNSWNNPNKETKTVQPVNPADRRAQPAYR